MINRSNYEEYLLMYLDGELSSPEVKAVEAFLEQNPDLQEELELLRQTILQPEENIGFAGKESLYKKETGITLNNYQDYFLLYIDNELSTSEKEAVETFVLQQPQLQDEFTLLKQTVLPAENIVFANKTSLYRKEEKRRPVVISLRWASLAAAVMIGIVVLVMFNNNNNNEGNGGPVVVTPGNNGKPTTNTIQSTENNGRSVPVSEQATQNNSTTVAGVNNSNSNKTAVQPLQQQVKNEPVQEEIVANNYKPQQENITIPVMSDPVTGNFTKPVPPVIVTGDGNDEKEPETNTNTISNNYVQPSVYTEELETEDDKTVYVGALQVNPDKVRGFFRKASRFLSSKVKGNDDDDTGKGKIKVANIEMKK